MISVFKSGKIKKILSLFEINDFKQIILDLSLNKNYKKIVEILHTYMTEVSKVIINFFEKYLGLYVLYNGFLKTHYIKS